MTSSARSRTVKLWSGLCLQRTAQARFDNRRRGASRRGCARPALALGGRIGLNGAACSLPAIGAFGWARNGGSLRHEDVAEGGGDGGRDVRRRLVAGQVDVVSEGVTLIRASDPGEAEAVAARVFLPNRLALSKPVDTFTMNLAVARVGGSTRGATVLRVSPCTSSRRKLGTSTSTPHLPGEHSRRRGSLTSWTPARVRRLSFPRVHPLTSDGPTTACRCV